MAVFVLTTLKRRFQECLEEKGFENADGYQSKRFKKQLASEWPDLSFIPQPGLSDLVCSGKITVDEVLRKALTLAHVLNEVIDEGAESDNEVDDITEDSIVHQAVGIWRRRYSQIQKLDGEYYSPADMAADKLNNWIDPLLYKTIGWLTDKQLYDDASDLSEMKPDIPCLNIACDIISHATSVMSPKHLGLAVSLQHDFGSRKLVDTMLTLGYCISYTELRRFLTSAALHVDSAQAPSKTGAYIPPEITSRAENGCLIGASADNWDHNERTVDGKRTTHDMTSIFVQRKSVQPQPCSRILRSPTRALNLDLIQGGDLAKLLPYRKPTSRPEPHFKPPATPDEILPLKDSANVKRIEMIETVYNVARSGYGRQDGSYVPTWGQFHATLEAKDPGAVSNISFNPIIMASPTDHQTIYTTMKRLKESMENLGQTHVPIVFDMGLMTKALEITWAFPKELAGVVLCEGGMHLSTISAIGHLYGDVGLNQLLHESGVFAEGSVQNIL
jgi:hypothetical protein